MMSSMLLSAQQIKELFGIHRNTLLKWEKEGLLQPVKTPGGRRRYRRSDIEGLPEICEKKTERADVILFVCACINEKAGRIPEESNRKT
jgi:predicted site-specific integrase-resolvase